MKATTRIAIAGLLSAAGSALTALAAEINSGGAEPQDNTPAEPSAAAEAPAPKPRKTKAAPAPVVETPAAPAEPEAPAEEKPADPAPETPAAPAGTVTNPDYPRMKKLIEPIVTGDSEDMKKQLKAIILKYSPNGGLKTMEAKNHAAFEKDLDALFT